MGWFLLVQVVKTISLILFYYSFSISITFYNKWILMGYPFPVSITMVHLVVSFIMAWVVRKLTSCYTGNPPLNLPWSVYLKNIAPIAIFSALDIGFSNWSLLFITISLYTMSKSTALIFVLLFSILFRLQKPRAVQILVVVMIVAGLFLFTYESTSFNTEGFFLVMSASLISGVRWTTAQFTLQKEEFGLSNPVDVTFHLQPVMMMTLLPLAIPVDGVAVSTSVLAFRANTLGQFCWTVLLIAPAALLAFMLGVSEYLLVYHTSGLTLSISGVFKEILILTISTLWWEEERLETIHLVGMIVCVSGIALHVLLKAIHIRNLEKEKVFEESSKSKEDTVQLISDKSQNVESDSDQSEVLYETSHM